MPNTETASPPVIAPQTSFSPEQINAAVAARDKAGQNTPAAVLDAFFPQSLTIAGLTLQPVSMATLMLLEKIDSPFVAQSDAEQEIKIQLTHMLEALLILSLPLEQAQHIVITDGVYTAALQLGSRLAPAELQQLGPAIRDHINAGFSTAVATRPAGKEGQESGLGESPSPAADLAGS